MVGYWLMILCDRWWMKQAKHPVQLSANMGLVLFALSLWAQGRSGLPSFWIGLWLMWMAYVDHQTYHVSDLSLLVLAGFVFTHRQASLLPTLGLRVWMLLPFIAFSLNDEAVGWGDTWILSLVMGTLSVAQFKAWILLSLILALSYAWPQRKKKPRIALVPWLALSYGLLFIVGLN